MQKQIDNFMEPPKALLKPTRVSQPVPLSKASVNSHHLKTKSAVIPKLDLTKIKRDVDFESQPEVQQSEESSHMTLTEGFDEDEMLLDDPVFAGKGFSDESIHFKEIDIVNRKACKLGASSQDLYADQLSSIEQAENIPVRKPAIPMLDFSKLKGVQQPAPK